jgi:multiple sugar transport system substrate-binding protein
MSFRALFGTVGATLAVCFALTLWTAPDMRSDVPVIYWGTDPNPARYEQIELFHRWLVDNGHTTPEGRPVVEMRLDTANSDYGKKTIQGISGVGADIIDGSVPYFQPMGMLADVTEEGKRFGFGLDATYEALEPMLFVDGRQYAFPCNVNVVGLWCNADTFRKYGMDPPPRDWDFDTFERIGREFVKRANPGDGPRKVFFANGGSGWQMDRFRAVLHRSVGVSEFNETLTACGLNDPGYVRVLERLYKWTHVDHLLPTAADEQSFSSESGYGGSLLSLFQNGNYAMIMIGRWCLIRIREFENPPRLSVSGYPCDAYPTSIIATRAALVYEGGGHRDYAALFLAYLASEEYNTQIIRDADALPPNPRFTSSEEYLRPAGHENEWGCHEVPVEWSRTTAIAPTFSPFIQNHTRWVQRGFEELMDKDIDVTATEVAADTAARIDDDIKRTVERNRGLRERYEEYCELQRKIDERRRSGRKVPLEWIKNPFHRKYYADKGWIETSSSPAAGGEAGE